MYCVYLCFKHRKLKIFLSLKEPNFTLWGDIIPAKNAYCRGKTEIRK